MTDDPRTRVWRLMEAHGLGWIDNGKPDAACYCGYRPRLGESWHMHVTDALIHELGVTEEWADSSQFHCTRRSARRYVTAWFAERNRKATQ